MAVALLAREIAWLDPLAAFASLRRRSRPVLLDSAAGGRWSYVAADPFLFLTSKDGRITLGERTFTGDPFAVLQRALAHYRRAHDPDLPVPFQTGAVGWFGYDLAHHLERLPHPAGDDLAFPDLMLGFYDAVLAFDLQERRAYALSSGCPESVPEAALLRRQLRLDELVARLDAAGTPDPSPAWAELPVASDFTRAAYETAVRRVIDYILAGDIFQANLSQRFRAELPDDVDPWSLYLRLRRRNPAPFASFLAFGEVVLASASPERFLELRDGRVETRPIKGTRPRGADPDADEALGRELEASEKDRAENVMIVDLLRNDLSRVCRDHSVETPEVCALESFATVHHLVSTVTGRLKEGLDAVDLLRATFPGGSITGAPKIRAMEIIAELEPTRRGPYCGAVGWLGFDGWMDTSITIRTFAVWGRQVAFQAGGGIVADSEPAAEYEETLAKARALVDALKGGA